jgi:hypothetical protein
MAYEPTTDLIGNESSSDNQEQTTQWYDESNAELVTNKGWKTPNDAVKSYSELEKSMGGRVKIPTDESSAEERNAFYQKTGRPDNPDGYTPEIPEAMEEFRDEGMEAFVRQALFDGGASKQAGENLIQGYYNKLNADMAAAKIAGEKQLHEEFGADYDANITIADRYFSSADPEYIALMKRAQLLSNPIFIKHNLEKGKQTMSDTLVTGQTANSDDKGYKPQYTKDPSFYANGEDEESKKARAWFEARGHTY